jgi:hypothetical protein
MGEAKRKRQGPLVQGDGQAEAPQVVDTLGGRMQVRWDNGAAATPHGQPVFFAQFVATTGVLDRWVLACLPFDIPKWQRRGQTRRIGHADAGAAGKTPAPRPHHRAARRRGGRSSAVHEQDR